MCDQYADGLFKADVAVFKSLQKAGEQNAAEALCFFLPTSKIIGQEESWRLSQLVPT
jgi:hypothetical protein